MQTFKISVDHVVTTRVDVEVSARTLADAQKIAKRAVIPQSSFNRDIKTIKRRYRSAAVDVVDTFTLPGDHHER